MNRDEALDLELTVSENKLNLQLMLYEVKLNDTVMEQLSENNHRVEDRF
jgi:hypothetical protein